MPRSADQHLQERILVTAQRLYRTRGEASLTLRAVARLAGTTTTTVYKRFRNKEALRIALAQRFYRQFTLDTTSALTLRDMYRNHLQFAETHPREYQLLFGPAWTEVFGPGRPRPITEWFLAQLAEKFGGKPQDYLKLHLALFLTTHGAASLLAVSPNSSANAGVRETCIAICDTIMDNMQIFRRRGQAKSA